MDNRRTNEEANSSKQGDDRHHSKVSRSHLSSPLRSLVFTIFSVAFLPSAQGNAPHDVALEKHAECQEIISK